MLPTGNADLENYARMEHEGVTSPCSFFFPPLSGCDQPRPKGQPIPPAGYLVRYKTDRRLPLLCVPAGGLPSRKMERSAIGAGCKMPQGTPGRKGSILYAAARCSPRSGPEGRTFHAAKPYTVDGYKLTWWRLGKTRDFAPLRARENGPLAILRGSGTALRRP